jgi:Asp-tRNA(Asn)/Glu-tRNA(Gln) amidotransferase A subunit family amidase
VVRSETSWQNYFQPKSAPKLAVMRTGVWQRASAEQQSNFDAKLVALTNAGAELVDYDLPEDTGLILQSANDLLLYEAARLYRDLVAAHPKSGAAVTELWSNGQTEGQITKCKRIKRPIYGRAGWICFG